MSWGESPPPSAPSADEDPAGLDAFLRAATARAVAERPASVDADPWRQAFHVQPPVGLLNDPNGLVQHDGVYHLCFQWHPFAPEHAHKFWAHLTSTDLVHWIEQPLALTPSAPFDVNGCYSGSGIVHDGAVRFLYTGNVWGPSSERLPFQNLATLGTEGSVAKHPANPVVRPLPGCTGDIRDPKVWRHGDAWWMVVGAQAEDLVGTALLLRSTDLTSWELLGPMAGGADASSGYMWECPDLVALDGRDVLVVSPLSDHGEAAGAGRYVDRTMYAVGRLDYATGRFAGGEFRRVDLGPDFYAPQSFVAEDCRTIQVGWMGMPDHDGQPSLAEKHPTVANGWVHCLTVPRELSLDGDALVQVPVRELELLRRGGTATNLVCPTDEPVVLPVLGDAGAALDLLLQVHSAPGGSLEIRLRDGAAQRPAVVVVDPHAGTVTLDRTRLGTGEGGRCTGTFRPAPSVDVRILLDHSSVEVFVDGGRLAMSARIYPVRGDERVTIVACGGPATLEAEAWAMTRA